jgi:hypothetical protein
MSRPALRAHEREIERPEFSKRIDKSTCPGQKRIGHSTAGIKGRISHAKFFELADAAGIVVVRKSLHPVGVVQQVLIAVSLADLAQVLSLGETLVAVSLLYLNLFLLFVVAVGGVTGDVVRRR